MPILDKILFVINSGSGNKSTDWREEIETYFSEKPSEIIFYELDKKFDEDKLRKLIQQHLPQALVAVGGDGTISLLSAIAKDVNIPLGILPAGSANGMATELGIPAKPEDALKVLEEGVIKPCDVIKINNEHYALHLSDIGMNAHLIKYFDEGKLRGQCGYARVVLKTIINKKRVQVSLTTKDAEVKTDALMVVLANASKYGTGMVINPLGVINDGLFEVVIVKKLSLKALFRMLVKPELMDPKHVEIFQCRAALISTSSKIHFQVDGEYIGKVKSLRAEIVPGYFNLILPKD